MATATNPQAKAAERFQAEIAQFWEQTKRWHEVAFKAAPPRLGLTPRELVYQRNKMKVYRYIGRTEKRYRTPLVIFFALLNRPYVLDLYPGNSMIEYLLDEGFDIFLVDWGNPGPEDRGLMIDHYVLDYMPRAIRKVQKITGAPDISLVGFCMGGTLGVIYAALHPDAPLRNLVLLVTPVKVDEPGVYSLWLSERFFNVDKLVNVAGNIHPDVLETGAKLTRPVSNYWSNYVGLFEKILDPQKVHDWQAMDRWVSEGVYFPGEFFRQWITDLYQHNRLFKGELMIRGRRVDLSRITCPVLSLAADRDHLVPVNQAKPVMDLVSSEDKEFVVVPGGHISLILGRGARRAVWPKISSWLAERSESTVDGGP